MRLAVSLTALLSLWLGHTLISSTDRGLGKTASVEGHIPGSGGPVTAAGRWYPSSRPAAPRVSRSRSPEPTPRHDRLNWHALAMCESTDNPHAVSASGRYRGLYQFDLTTWRSVGGHGDPAAASRAEQTYRAQRLYRERGRSPWPVCGRRL